MSDAVLHPRPAVLADVVSRGLVADVALVLGAAGLTGLAAQVAFPIPGTPVPVTLQTFAVLLAGAALGWQRALASMALYVAAGLAGVPWFAGHSSGLPKATFGYLLGFILAAVLVGRLAGRGGDRTPLRTIGTMTLGTLVVYLVGVPVLDANVPGGLAEALELGAVPFLLGDAVKVLAAAGVLPGAWWLVRRMKGDAAA